MYNFALFWTFSFSYTGDVSLTNIHCPVVEKIDLDSKILKL